MDESEMPQTTTALPWFQRFWFVSLVAALLIAGAAAIATAANAFGENIRGTVYCGNGAVSGVFIEADRLPRTWMTGWEIQSGFATWHPRENVSVADFNYWLPYGGAYSIHFGCGVLPSDPHTWATDNRTPNVLGTGQEWWCDNPVNTGLATRVVTACRSN